MELAGRTLLGKYRIEGLLGQGGMGSVWRGTHLVTGRSVAIKVLDERFLTNVNVVQRFGREARAASAIQHEGIVEVLDLDQTESGVPFLVMELLGGETLSSRIERRGKLPQDEVFRIGTMLLEALEAAHQHGVVHRDLKPDNIHLVPAGRRGEIVKILDFGISSKADEANAKLTMTGSVLGTPHYMSPEQAMGETNLDRRVDIYGAGVVLYECLVGDVPFDAPNYNKLLRVILDDDAVPPSRRGAKVDPRFEAVVLRTLAKDREQRPQTARALLDQLRAAHAGDAPVRARDDDRPSTLGPRSASASFARPESLGALPTPTPVPGSAPLSSGVRSRTGASQQMLIGSPAPRAPVHAPGALPYAPSADEHFSKQMLAVASGELGRPGTPPGAPIEPPRALTPLRLDAKGGGGGGLGGLEDLDGLASGSLSLELDESALVRPSRHESASSASSSGRHRAISDRAIAAAGGVARTTPGQSSAPPPAHARARSASGTSSSGMTAAARSASGTSSSGMTAAGRSHDNLPAMRAPLPPAPEPHEVAPSPPPPRGPWGWWQGLEGETRRWITLGVAGLALCVIVIAGVRAVVRPGDEAQDRRDVPSTSAIGVDERAASPEWVIIDVDGVPPRAELRLDGLPGATLPLRVRRGTSHVLEIRADGYEDRRLELRADTNQQLHADMRPAVGTTQHSP